MQAFRVIGGKPLQGVITPQGSKNEALMVMNAALLACGKTIIYNIPNILDISTLLEIFSSIGVSTEKCDNNGYIIDTSNLHSQGIESDVYAAAFKKIRGGITVAAPILARFGKSVIYKPGGDKIGRRKIDIHLLGFQELGASIEYDISKARYDVKAAVLTGSSILLEEASVTGTANIIMASVLASGVTTIYNAACEPHIQQLCHMLVSMGAKISGIGSNLLTIEGVKDLLPTTHTIKADMLEVGSFIALSAMTKSNISIKNACVEHLDPVINTFTKLGVCIEVHGDDLILDQTKDTYKINQGFSNELVTISDAPWPGFPADLVSAALVVAIQACGTVVIHQKMFESRLFFVDYLIEMGAQIVLCDPHRACVIGLNRSQLLRATTMNSPDIRAGMALLIAALSASGTSTIYNISQIDRGYESLDIRLKNLGADIERIAAK